MNTLHIYPKEIRKKYEQNIKNAGIILSPEEYHNRIFLIIAGISLVSLIFFWIFKIKIFYSLGVFILLNIFFFLKTSLKASTRIKKMETAFPDVISLMASNLRSGITIEKAFLLSARPEFTPLDKEILDTGKEISTGKDVVQALKIMSEKINSEKISKIIMLIVSGLKAGGNIADLLEQTAKNMKEQEIIEKKIASNTLMYAIFIFVAVSVGAPVLFGLSSVLVEIIMGLSERIPETAGLQANLPLTFQSVSISLNFVIYFALAFITITDFISCFVIGVVNKGEGKSGLRLFFPILIISLSIFFLIRKFISGFLIKSIGAF